MRRYVDDEFINWEKLVIFLRERVPGIPDGELEVRKFSEGYSNPTYLLKIGEWEGVLRRPPFGAIPPKAHDMEREFRLLTKISRVFPLAPKPYVFGQDDRIMNRHFYVMERKRGIVINQSLPEKFSDSRKFGPIISRSIIDTMIKLHAIDYQKAGLGDLGRPEGYLERQVHGWIKRFNRSLTDNVLPVKALERWLITRMPASKEATIVHNDFKLNNLVFDADDLSIVRGLLDWELAAIGDPLTDVGSSIVFWGERSDPEIGISVVTNQPGFISRREFAEMYARLSGRDLSEITYYVTFGFYKLAAILQQIYFRWYHGELHDDRFRNLHQAVNNLMEMAEATRNNRFL